MNYFISSFLEIKDTPRGLGVFTKIDIAPQVIIEHSPFSSCWATKWKDTPENLRKIVFSFPQGEDNYVIALGHISIYNHSDNNNAKWLTSENGIYVRTLRNIDAGEEIFIHYGDAYWSGGWPKY
jgi:SET domain-containing protein